MSLFNVDASSIIQKGNIVEGRLIIKNVEANQKGIAYSTPYNIGNIVKFQIMVAYVQNTRSVCSQVFISIEKIGTNDSDDNDNINYTAKFTSQSLGVKNQMVTCDDGTWHLMHGHQLDKLVYEFDLHVVFDVEPKAGYFSSLHEDSDLTDFELRGTDGAVQVHKVLLAAHSPVLKRMLCGTWKETKKGHVDIQGASRLTLQHLKDYLYLRILPESGLEHLLLLASCYMMNELEIRCVEKMINKLNAKNACDLLHFSFINNQTKLMMRILSWVQDKVVKVVDLVEPALSSPSLPRTALLYCSCSCDKSLQTEFKDHSPEKETEEDIECLESS